MSNTTKWVLAVIVVVIIIIIGFTGDKTPTSAEPIKIGFIAPLTGDAAVVGENVKVAAEVARDEINEAGGIDGRPLEIIFEDGQCNPKSAADAGNKLINIDKVKVILGGFCSSETLAVAPLAGQAKVIMISPASTSPDVTEAGDFVFRVVPSDSFQGIFSAEYIKSTLNKDKVALLSCLSDWCLGVNNAFKEEFEKLGGEILIEELFPQESRDLRSALTKIKAKNPDLIYFVSYEKASVVGLRQIKELAIDAILFGADGWSDPKIWEDVSKEESEGAMFVEPANRDLPEEFLTEMNNRTGSREVNVYTPRTYDALKILAMVMNEVGLDSEAIKSELYKVSNYQGIADVYTFDENGDVLGAEYLVKEIRDSEMVEVE